MGGDFFMLFFLNDYYFFYCCPVNNCSPLHCFIIQCFTAFLAGLHKNEGVVIIY